MFFSRQIQQFIAIVRAGSFVRAAKEVSLTSSALSHGINELEQRLGKKLIIRNKAGITLTKCGLTFYDDIAPLYDKATAIINCAKGESKNIVIGVDTVLNPTFHSIVENLLSKFCGRIEIITISDAVYPSEILNEGCDIFIGVSLNCKDNQSKNIIRIDMSPERCGIIASKSIADKYSDPVDILKNEVVFQHDKTLKHIAFRELINKIDGLSLNCNYVVLPYVVDIICALSEGIGVYLSTDSILSHPAFARLDLKFIEMPETLECIICRSVYYKKEREDELKEFIACIKNI